MGLDGLQRVQRPVIALHRVHIVVRRAPGEERDRQGYDHHCRHDPAYEHRLLFNRTRWARETAAGNENVLPGQVRGGVVPGLPGYPYVRRTIRGRRPSGMASRRGLALSRFDKIGSVSPQSAPTAGSSQASPSSSESL